MQKLRAVAVGMLGAALVGVSCGEGPGESTGGTGGKSASSFDGPPVIVVGMDGLEWDVMTPLLDAGRLPHFQSVIERGVAGGLATFQPTFSPVVWTSIATGVARETHGILNFSEEAAGRLKPNGLPYTSNSRKVPAVWNIASDHERDVLAVGWWVSWPAEEVDGRIIASYAAQAQGKVFWKAGVWEEGIPEMTFPPELINDAMPALQDGAPDGPLRAIYDEKFGVIPGQPRTSANAPADPWEFPRLRDSFFRIGYHGDATHLKLFKQQMQLGVADLNMVYFGLPDVAGHFWWRYYEPDQFEYLIPEEHLGLLQQRIDFAYEVADQWLGEILEVAPENARILIVSDHGMHAANRRNPQHPQSGAHEDAPPGVFIAAGPGIERRGLLPEVEWRFPVQMGPRRFDNVLDAPERIASVYDITPTILHWLGLPAAEDMLGEPLVQLSTADAKLSTALPPVPSYASGFRAATPPRVPQDGMNEDFQESFLEALGYKEAAANAAGG